LHQNVWQRVSGLRFHYPRIQRSRLNFDKTEFQPQGNVEAVFNQTGVETLNL